MQIFDYKQHPLIIIEEIFKNKSRSNYRLEFAYYNYIPRNLEEEKNRKIFQVDLTLCSKDFFIEKIKTLPPNIELAIQSRIFSDHRTYYLPFIDFTSPDFEEIYKKLKSTFDKEFLQNLYVFSSGRSYHAYFIKVLSKKQWVSFLGTLLLLNDSRQLVDHRWVGHSLRTGYSALRWSCNSSQYKDYPKLYARINNENVSYFNKIK